VSKDSIPEVFQALIAVVVHGQAMEFAEAALGLEFKEPAAAAAVVRRFSRAAGFHRGNVHCNLPGEQRTDTADPQFGPWL